MSSQRPRNTSETRCFEGREGQEVEKTRIANHSTTPHTPAPRTLVQGSTRVLCRNRHASSNVVFSTENVYNRACSHYYPHTTHIRVSRRRTPVPPLVAQESTQVASVISKPTCAPCTVAFSMENVNGKVISPPKLSVTTYRRDTPLQKPIWYRIRRPTRRTLRFQRKPHIIGL